MAEKELFKNLESEGAKKKKILRKSLNNKKSHPN